MKYTTGFYCFECDHRLTNNEMMNSWGRCPYCGFKDKSAGTIVKVKEKSIPIKKRWWQFWK